MAELWLFGYLLDTIETILNKTEVENKIQTRGKGGSDSKASH